MRNILMALLCVSPAAIQAAAIQISVTVPAICTMSNAAIPFGAYAAPSMAIRASKVTVNCSTGTQYAVALDEGTGGNGATRRMVAPDGTILSYDIYKDSARTERWGSGASAAVRIGSGVAQSLPLYRSVPSKRVASGAYSDVVIVTVSY